jgi:general secretion pathway protein J
MVISSSLMALILVSGYLCLSAAVASQKQIEPRLEVIQNARVAMALMAADLRAACPLSKDCEFLGTDRTLGEVEADNLDFATHNYTPRRASEGDFCEVSFFLSRDPQSGQYVLYRRRNPSISINAFAGGKNEEIARGLLGLRFEYYDGLDWYDSWGELARPGKVKSSRSLLLPNLEGLPLAVRITLWFNGDPHPRAVAAKTPGAPQPPKNDGAAAPENPASTEIAAAKEPLVFQTIVPIELASAPQRGSAGDSGASGGDATAQPVPGAVNGGQP